MSTLRDELINDPLGRGYSGMTDDQVVADINSTYRSRNVPVMTASDVLNATDETERSGLSNANTTALWRLLAIGDLDPWGAEAQIMTDIFGGGSVTISTLQAARVEAISRAAELGLREVKPGHVQVARA